MIYKKNACLILTVMALSACNICWANDIDSQGEFLDGNIDSAIIQQADVKANKETIEKAQAAMNAKDYLSAIGYLNAYIASKPKKYEVYKLRGQCYYALRRYALAEADFQTAIDLKTDDDKFKTGTKYVSAIVLGADKTEQLQNPELGNLYGELMYAQKAQNKPAYEISYDKAVEYNSHIYLPRPKKDEITKINCPQKYGTSFNPQGVDAQIKAVIGDIEKGKFHEALYKTPAIISEYPNYYLGYYLSGVAFAGMENDDDAIQSFETSLRLNQYDFESLASIGEVYYSKAEKTFSSSDAQKSIKYFLKALELNPNCNSYHFYIGLNKLLTKDYQGAVISFNSAVKIKSNDYNSLYYKLIAQYMSGDYRAVEEGATLLLYKRVSNYNSVQYLRALAKYKQGMYDSALSDLESIHNNMNDIYNEDVKPLSEKDKILESYIYYMKALILTQSGNGVKADMDNALSNPIIANILMADNGFVISAHDLDTQFDYIRETFSDRGLDFKYINPDYKVTFAGGVISPETSPKSVRLDENYSSEYATVEFDGAPSMAQILAAQSLPYVGAKFLPSGQNATNVVYDSGITPVISDENSVAKIVNEVEKLEAAAQDLSAPIVIEAEQKVVSSDFEIKYENPEPQKIVENIAQTVQVEQTPEKTVIKTTNPLPAESFSISYDKGDFVDKLAEKATQAVSEVTEKHADVDLSQFVMPKTLTNISDDDEVIMLEPQKTFFDNKSVQVPQLVVKPDLTTVVNDLSSSFEKLTENISEPELVVPGITVVPKEKIAKPIVVLNDPVIEKVIQPPSIVSDNTVNLTVDPAVVDVTQDVSKTSVQIQVPNVDITKGLASLENNIEKTTQQVQKTVVKPVVSVAKEDSKALEAPLKNASKKIKDDIKTEKIKVEKVKGQTKSDLKAEKAKIDKVKSDVKTEKVKAEKIKTEKVKALKQKAKEAEQLLQTPQPVVEVQTPEVSQVKVTAKKSILKSLGIAEDPVIVEDKNLSQLEEIKPLKVKTVSSPEVEAPKIEVSEAITPWYKKLFKKSDNVKVAKEEKVKKELKISEPKAEKPVVEKIKKEKPVKIEKPVKELKIKQEKPKTEKMKEDKVKPVKIQKEKIQKEKSGMSYFQRRKLPRTSNNEEFQQIKTIDQGLIPDLRLQKAVIEKSNLTEEQKRAKAEEEKAFRDAQKILIDSEKARLKQEIKLEKEQLRQERAAAALGQKEYARQLRQAQKAQKEAQKSEKELKVKSVKEPSEPSKFKRLNQIQNKKVETPAQKPTEKKVIKQLSR